MASIETQFSNDGASRGRRICFALDNSKYSAECLAWAKKNRYLQSGDYVHLLTVVAHDYGPVTYYNKTSPGVLIPEYSPIDIYPACSQVSESELQDREKAFKLLKMYEDDLAKWVTPVSEDQMKDSTASDISGVDTPRVVIKRHVMINAASPERGIAHFVSSDCEGDGPVDLLIMGSRGHGAETLEADKSLHLMPSGRILGSVSDYVLRHAKCPMVVVRYQSKFVHDKEFPSET